jgi:hypothetical protein
MDNQLIASRRDRAEIFGGAHALAADMYASRHRQISIPVIILSTVLGTTTLSSFIEIGKTAKLFVDIVICILAITVAVLAALQTFLDYASRSQAHTNAAAKFFALAQKWELLFNEDSSMREVSTLDELLAELIQRVPRVSIKLQQEAMKRHAELERGIPSGTLYRSIGTFLQAEPSELDKEFRNKLA